MSEIKINFDKWDDAIDDISSHILDIYDKRIDFLSEIQNSISGLPGDYGYKWPAHGDVGNSKNDVENKKNDLIRFRDTLRNTYDYVKSEEENLAQRLYSDSNNFMHANGIQPEYEKSAFQKLCEGIANGVKDAISVIVDAAVWLWDSGIIQLVGEILIAAAAITAFVLCFPVSGVWGVLTAIGLGWGAAKALVDVVADSAGVGYYIAGDKESAKECSAINMRSVFEFTGNAIDDGAEFIAEGAYKFVTGNDVDYEFGFFDACFDTVYLGLDTVEFITDVGNTSGLVSDKGMGKLFGAKDREFIGTAFAGGDKDLYKQIDSIKKIGKAIKGFPENGFASLTELAKINTSSDFLKGAETVVKILDKGVNYANTPLTIGLEHSGLSETSQASIMQTYSNIKTAKDFGKTVFYGAYGNATVFNPKGTGMNFNFLQGTSLGYAPTLGTLPQISAFMGLSNIK